MAFRLKTSVLMLIALVVWSGLIAQVDAPQVECTTVATNGQVTLSWSAPDDPNGYFTSYSVYSYDVATTTQTLITNIANYNTTSYTAPGTDGNSQPECFVIETNYNDGSPQSSPPSEVICSMHLIANPGLQPGVVELAWNFPLLGDPAVIGGDFTVFMEYPAGSWNAIATLPYAIGNNTYDYEVSICEADLNFQIRFANGGVCNSFSNVAGGTFQDQIDPQGPVITSISVDSLTNDAVVNWNPPPQGDVYGYIIYQCFPGLNAMPIDTIWDASATSWLNVNSNANLASESYNIAAFDSCLTDLGEPDPGPANGDCVNSIYLTHVWQSCSDEVALGWNEYTGWDMGVAFYEIYAAEEPDPGTGIYNPSFVLAVVDGNTNTFLHEGATLGSSYKYRVKAYASQGGYTASSNNRIANLAYPDAPAYTHIRRASVNSDTEIEIVVDLDPAVGIPHTYYLSRKAANQDFFIEINSIETVADNQVTFIDNDVDTGELSYTYRVRIENNCGDSVGSSNIGKTILLEGLVNRERLVNTLVWSPYEEWGAGVDTYGIVRTIDDGLPELLGTVPSGVLFYEDDVSDLIGTEGEFCYTVIAYESPDGQFTPDASISNVLCLTQEPVIWVPNAFVVDGFNQTFRPVISFADFDNYRMQIYSRWGNVIFETEDINEAWDGKYRDELVPEGMYAYFISVADGAGRIYERRGTLVMLIAGSD